MKCPITFEYLNLEFGEIVAFIQFFHSEVMTCCSGLGSKYFAILRKHPLRNNNQQSNLPRKNKPKDLKSVYKAYYKEGLHLRK